MARKYSRTVGRVDWTADDDLKLAETVLRALREGRTAASGIREASEILNRTKEGASFRWYSNLSKQYRQGIEIARKHATAARKENKVVEQETLFFPEATNVAEETIHNEELVEVTNITTFETPRVEVVEKVNEQNDNNEVLSEAKLINEYLQNLIDKHNTLVQENATLKEENKNLRNQVIELQYSESNTNYDELAKLIKQTAQIIKR